MNSLLVAPSLNHGRSSPPFFLFWFLFPFPLIQSSDNKGVAEGVQAMVPVIKTGRHRSSDLNDCVKVLIEHLAAWGWTHWFYPQFSLGPDKEYWCSQYGPSIWDFSLMWSFSPLSNDYSFRYEWTYCSAWLFWPLMSHALLMQIQSWQNQPMSDFSD